MYINIHRQTIISPDYLWKLSFSSSGSSTKGIVAIDDITIDASGPCRGRSGSFYKNE